MTDTAEIIIREFSEWIKDELSEFESDCERGWKRMENRPNKSDEFYVEGAGEFHNDLQTSRKAFASRFIAALTEAGIMLLTKQQAIDYVMDLPIDELGETHTWPVNPNTAGRRLRELQKAMIKESGK